MANEGEKVQEQPVAEKKEVQVLSVMNSILSRPEDKSRQEKIKKAKKAEDDKVFESLVRKEISMERRQKRESVHKRLEAHLNPQEVNHHKTALKGVLRLFTAIQQRRREVLGTGAI
ncbi:hypothetical protein J8273_6467 [Carpediemonas membranifera]|uniref:Uncharacterized protein n=1 Tax=Carpediemonas membranifera TaxID=201153 RepID=A0A8J6E0D6_9EUKA|nr:hypothetical protein J8273_6467 [Carpediemonas membranifera]|eukprot:KAG9391691.1 hypothetical protein J8273_6467 [Carpediemonas membranifera]